MTNKEVIDPLHDAKKFLEERKKVRDEFIRVHGYEEFVEPADNQVVIRKFPDKKTSSGGIIMPGEDEPVKVGEVVAVGPGKFQPAYGDVVPIRHIRPGQYVIFGQFAGTNTIKLNGEVLLVLREDEITGHYGRRSTVVRK